MDSTQDLITVDLDYKGKVIQVYIICRDNFAVFSFSDPSLALKWYQKDIGGKVPVFYRRKINSVIYKYIGKSKDEIRELLRDEIRLAGGQEK